MPNKGSNNHSQKPIFCSFCGRLRQEVDKLIEGPNNAELSKTIPEGTKINKIELKGDTLYIDLSKEFIENHEGGEEKENATIYSIVNTMTNLTEIN